VQSFENFFSTLERQNIEILQKLPQLSLIAPTPTDQCSLTEEERLVGEKNVPTSGAETTAVIWSYSTYLEQSLFLL